MKKDKPQKWNLTWKSPTDSFGVPGSGHRMHGTGYPEFEKTFPANLSTGKMETLYLQAIVELM